MSGTVEAEPFDWAVTSDRRVLVTRGGRRISVVAGMAGSRLADRLDRADADQAQHLLARATGNYKRGNERG